jgi:(R,R)-butanediol dehydrogenase/meso-butanediol dehydrogenase/diacetyl reductase
MVRNLKAAVYHGREDVRIEDRPEPKPGKGEVKVEVKYCGICGTDLHEYYEGPIFIPTQPHPLTGKKLPVIIGHEFSGDIVEVGEGVKGWNVGDRVTVDACIVDWTCPMCKRGMTNYCYNLGFNGLAADGAFAEYVVVPAYQLHKLAPNVSYEEGALVEPLACGVESVRASGMKEGDTVFIAGAGPIGLVTLLAARAAGAREIYVSEPMKARRELAKQLGATEVFDPTTVDVKKEVLERTHGIGVDVAFECVGYEPALNSCIDVTRKRGTICVIGIFPKPVTFDPFSGLVATGKHYVGSLAYEGVDFDISIALIADGRINVKPLITKKIKLDNLVEEGFEELHKHRERHIKILVSPK